MSRIIRNIMRWRTNIDWYGSNVGCLRQMQEKMQYVDCIVEMHDARIPVSGRNLQFHEALTSSETPHILMLNKCDLIDPSEQTRTANLVEHRELLQHALFVSCKARYCRAEACLLSYLRALALKSGKDSYNVKVFGIPHVGKRTLINLYAAKEPVNESNKPYIQISKYPYINIFREPGILLPRIVNHEMGLRLALLGCLPKQYVPHQLLAEYLLYWLNKNKHYEYVEYIGCKESTFSIQSVLQQLAEKESLKRKVRLQEGKDLVLLDTDAARKRFIELFRKGELGGINLDIDEC